MSFNDALSAYAPQVVEAMAAAHNVHEPAHTGSRARLQESLRRALMRPDEIARSVRQLGPVERAALKLVLDAGGAMSAERVRAALTKHGVAMRPSRPHAGTAPADADAPPDPHVVGRPRFEDAIARATLYSLILSKPSAHDAPLTFAPGTHLHVPDSIADIIKAYRLLDPAQAVRFDPAPRPAHVAQLLATDFQRDLGRYWRHVRKAGALRVTAQGWLYKSDFKHVLAALNAPADAPIDEAANGRLWFARRMLRATRDLRDGPGANSISAVEEADSFLRRPLPDRVRMAFGAWMDHGAWNELARMGADVAGVEPHAPAPPELVFARRAVMRWLARASTDVAGALLADAWIDAAALVERIRRDDYHFLFPRAYRTIPGLRYNAMNPRDKNAQTPYFDMNNPYGVTLEAVQDEAQGWDVVERRFIALMLAGPAHWLGLLDLGYQEPAAAEGALPVAVRLTPAGAWLLNLGPAPQFVESGGRVLVQPNYTVLAMEPISDSVLAELDQFADLQGGDRAVSYQLTRQSVYRAQRAGWDAQRIIAFLESHQGGPLPVNVRRSLDEWQTQHSRITFHRGVHVLQYADEATRDLVRENLTGLQPLAPVFDMLPGGIGLDETLSSLHDSGWVPLVSRAGETDLDAGMRAGEDGRLIFKHRLPNIYMVARLAPLVERSEGEMRITAKSVRAALSSGMSADEILATLAQLHDGPLPDKLEAAIRDWANFYGEATLRQVVLIELSSRDVLQHILEDKALAKHLTPVETSARALAYTEAGAAARVRTLLEERGIAVVGE